LLNEIISLVNNPVIIIILLTFLHFLELRASIPYGILVAKMPWYHVFILAVIANIILAPIVYFILDKVIHLFFFIKPFEKWYHRKLEKTQKRIEPYVNKYGIVGIGLFIGIPLPGSGVYSGGLASYILKLGYKRFLYATIIGILIAGTAVTAITLSADAGNNLISKLFLKV